MKSPSPFARAVAVWPRQLSGVINGFAGFRAVFAARQGGPALLRVAGASVYRVWLNGRFLAHGPARAAHGFARVDEIPLDGRLVNGRNVLAIEVAGYEANSYYVVDQPSFLLAEVVVGGRVVAATATDGGGFDARVLTERVRKAQRFSWQRTFVEAYRLAPGCDAWRRDPDALAGTAACELRTGLQLLPRAVALPRYAVRRPQRVVSRGRLVPHVPEKLWKDRALVKIGPKYKGYLEEELEFVLSTELQQLASRKAAGKGGGRAVGELGAGEYAVLDFGANDTGFIGLQVRCLEPTRLVPTFDEMLSGGDVDFKRLGCTAAMCYELAPGTYRLESLEPYVFRYLKLQVLRGRCRVTGVYQRGLANPDAGAARFACDDPGLNAIFEAGRATFRQNVVDIYMDCPSRERAGWLCDSFFMGRVERDLCGHSRVERNFLENFLLPPSFDNLPDGMLPMCYPADHPNGTFIPNWALWFVVELEEYLARTGDRALVDAFAPRVLAMFRYFERFRNADGLLEKLESWVFVEWSDAAKFVQDVNYPSNMLYAGALDAAGRLYGRADLCTAAGQVRETIRAQSFDGTFFVDNAVRTDGRLEVTRNRTETCQYYAFFFGVATPARDPELWRKMFREFGPRRKRRDLHPDLPPSNAFIGSYLRMELLSRFGATPSLLREMKNFLLPMARLTGTLWENLTATASCNHGFASHACHVLLRDALGVAEIDATKRVIDLCLTRQSLRRCAGRIPVGDRFLSVRWEKRGRAIAVWTRAPAGFVVRIENRTGLALQRQ
jgi:alpha-L-rhamnosidase